MIALRVFPFTQNNSPVAELQWSVEKIAVSTSSTMDSLCMIAEHECKVMRLDRSYCSWIIKADTKT